MPRHAAHLARLGMLPVVRHAMMGGPKCRCVRSHASKRADEREKQAAARIRKTTPGKSGSRRPASPSTRKKQPAQNRKARCQNGNSITRMARLIGGVLGGLPVIASTISRIDGASHQLTIWGCNGKRASALFTYRNAPQGRRFCEII